MVRSLILIAGVCAVGFATIGCDKSPTGNNNSTPASAAGIYKSGKYSSYDSVVINLRSDSRFVAKYYTSPPPEVTVDSGAYTYSSGTVTCNKAAVDIIYSLSGNTLKGKFLDTYTKQ